MKSQSSGGVEAATAASSSKIVVATQSG